MMPKRKSTDDRTDNPRAREMLDRLRQKLLLPAPKVLKESESSETTGSTSNTNRKESSETTGSTSNTNRKESSETTGSTSNTSKKENKSKKLCGNDNAEKATRKIEIGWLNLEDNNKYKQVRKDKGGGTETLDVDKNFTQVEILQLGLDLFFPYGHSRFGNAVNFTYELRDYTEQLCSNLTVEEMYAATKKSKMRFYIATKPAVLTDTNSSLEKCMPTMSSTTSLIDSSEATEPIDKIPNLLLNRISADIEIHEVEGIPEADQKEQANKTSNLGPMGPICSMSFMRPGMPMMPKSPKTPMMPYQSLLTATTSDSFLVPPKKFLVPVPAAQIAPETGKTLAPVRFTFPAYSDPSTLGHVPSTNTSVSAQPISSSYLFQVFAGPKQHSCDLQSINSNLEIKYTRFQQSDYSGEISSLTCRSRQDCFNCCQNQEMILNGFDNYDPVDDGFIVTNITFNNVKILDSAVENNSLMYSVYNCPPNEKLIAFGPDVVNAVEDGVVILVCCSTQHGLVKYEWKSEEELLPVGFGVIHKVVVPGIYHCVVTDEATGRCERSQRVEVKQTKNLICHSVMKQNYNVEVGNDDAQVVVGNDDAQVVVGNDDAQVMVGKDDAQVVVGNDDAQVMVGKDDAQVVVGNDDAQVMVGKDDAQVVVMKQNSKVVLEKEISNSDFIPSSLQFIEQIPRHDIIFSNTDEIGRGAFGTVYKATWGVTTVAVKQVQFKRRKRAVEMALLKELSVHSRARHPYIVQLMGIALDDSFIYIVSEFVNGPNLEDLLFGINAVQLQLHEKTVIASQCAAAVAYLHNLRPAIIHQDIKPANVIIQCTHPPVAKLCDFGLGRIRTMQTMATTVGIQGTVCYLAPECLLHSKPSSTSSDVWSLGCTLTELLTGHELWNFGDDDNADVLTSVISALKEGTLPHAISLLTSDEKCSQVLLHCLNFDPEQRPSAADVVRCYV